MKFCYFWCIFSLRNEILLHREKAYCHFRKKSQCKRTPNQVSKSVRGIWMIIFLVWAQCIAMFPNLDKCNSQGVTFVLAFVEEWLWSANKTTQLAVITCLPTDTKRHSYLFTYFWRILALYDSGLFLENWRSFIPPCPDFLFSKHFNHSPLCSHNLNRLRATLKFCIWLEAFLSGLVNAHPCLLLLLNVAVWSSVKIYRCLSLVAILKLKFGLDFEAEVAMVGIWSL